MAAVVELTTEAEELPGGGVGTWPRSYINGSSIAPAAAAAAAAAVPRLFKEKIRRKKNKTLNKLIGWREKMIGQFKKRTGDCGMGWDWPGCESDLEQYFVFPLAFAFHMKIQHKLIYKAA